MPDVIEFLAPLPPRALRRNSETTVRGYRARLMREYQEQVWCAGWAEVGSMQSHPSTWARDGRQVVRGMAVTATAPLVRTIFLPWDNAHLVLTWRHHRQGPDRDNALASCKYLIDVLKATGPRPLGIVVDDGPAHLSIDMRTEKVATRAEEGVWVQIERRQG